MTKISKEIFEEIRQRLEKIEKENNIKILLAIESGSRAWWFESIDSDYDIRFIYSRQKQDYLSIKEKRDVIEYPIIDLIDINWWDLKKALNLFQKWNPTFSEWIKSPIIYSENIEFKNKVLSLEKIYFSPKNYIYHYLHMAEWNYREWLRWEYVKAKKYFYVLRPILACFWIEKHNSPPPIEFDILYNDCSEISAELRSEIDSLLERKKSWVELKHEKRIEILNEFLDKNINNFKNKTYNKNEIPLENLDEVFRRFIF